jgi:hypothetical protein
VIQLLLVAVLAVLWIGTVSQVGGTDFLRVTAFQFGQTTMRVTDVATGLVILGIIATMRGPLMLTGVALLVLWVLTLLGIPRVQGVPLEPLILLIIVVGTCVHVVTHRSSH